MRPLACAALAAACLGAVPLQAQQRRALGHGEPEAQVIGYYAAAMQFLPAGLPDRGGRLSIGGSATYVPSLSVEDRTVGFGGTKTMNTDWCSALPRLAVSKAFGRVSLELASLPPATMCGVEASVFGAALGYRAPLSPEWDGMIRVSGFGGRVKSAITCSEDELINPNNQTCYGGSVSADDVAPFAVAGNLIAAYRGWSQRRIEPYFTAGVRYERVDFDANYTRDSAQALAISTADPAHAVPPLVIRDRFRTTLSRVHLGAGAAWTAGRLRLGGAIVYSPGALLTASGSVAFLIGSSR